MINGLVILALYQQFLVQVETFLLSSVAGMPEKVLAHSLLPIHVVSAIIYFQVVSLNVCLKDLCILNNPAAACFSSVQRASRSPRLVVGLREGAWWCAREGCARHSVGIPATPQAALERSLSLLAARVIFRMISGLAHHVAMGKGAQVCDQWCQ